MSHHSQAYWEREVREGLAMRNHPNAVLRDRNRSRVRWAVKALREARERRERFLTDLCEF